jgi:hypothetical protein
LGELLLLTGAAAQPTNVVSIKDPAPWEAPKPPKIGSIPTGTTPTAEWIQFQEVCKTAFAGMKEAREKLKHAENIERAKILAAGINTAWNDMRKAWKEAVNA